MRELIGVLENFQQVVADDATSRTTLAIINNNAPSVHYSQLRTQFSAYDDKNADIDRDFYKTPVNSDPALVAVVQNILQLLQIPKVQWGRYTHCPVTVYDMLVELSERDDITPLHKRRLTQLIYLIDDKVAVRWDVVALVGLLGLFGLEMSLPFGGASVLKQVVTAALFFPGLSLLYSTGVFFYSLYQSIFDTTTPFFERIRYNFFNMIAASLKIVANSIVIAAAAVASPVVSILAVLASVVEVIKEAVGIAHFSSKSMDEITKDSLNMHDQSRKEVEHTKKINTLTINITASVLLTAISAVWMFAPAGIMLTVGAVLAMGVVYVAKMVAQSANESAMKVSLNEKFSKIEEGAFIENQEPQQALDQTLDTSHVIQATLHTAKTLESAVDTEAHEPTEPSSSPHLFSPKGPSFFSHKKVEEPEEPTSEPVILPKSKD